MSQKHLSHGSTCPPKEDGKLRLYSMEFCPFAQRARLVLRAKNIPHDIVNINLVEKPEWYFKIHPEGLVPALDTGNEVIVESLVIADYLEEKYPENPLYPASEEAKLQDKLLIGNIGPLVSAFSKCILGSETKTPEEWAKEFLEKLQGFEDELARRGTTFFGGDKPGMLDYMLWPWAERSGAVGIKLGQRLPFPDDKLTKLRAWKKEMKSHPVCAGIIHTPEQFWKTVQIKLREIPPNYDEV